MLKHVAVKGEGGKPETKQERKSRRRDAKKSFPLLNKKRSQGVEMYRRTMRGLRGVARRKRKKPVFHQKGEHNAVNSRGKEPPCGGKNNVKSNDGKPPGQGGTYEGDMI